MEQVFGGIAVLLFFFVPIMLLVYVKQRSRKKAFDALPEGEKQKINERKNIEAKSGISLFLFLLGGALVKAGVSWTIVISIEIILIGISIVIWLAPKILNKKKK
jgi:hypothetical protein